MLLTRRVDLCLLAGADGVHLPERGLPVAVARRLLPRAIVGASRHDAAGVAAATEATYVTLSPFAAVPGKGSPLAAAEIEAALAHDVPVLALGGVAPSNMASILRPDLAGVAVLRAVNGPRAAENLDALCALLDIRP